MTKKYKLLQDMPYVRKGAIYEDDGDGYTCITPEFLVEGAAKHDLLGRNAVEKALPGFWEEVKEERIQVVKFLLVGKHTGTGNAGQMWYMFVTDRGLPEEKLPSIKSAIEDVLNDQVFNSTKTNQRLEQLKEIEKAEIKAFEAARSYTSPFSNPFVKYETFEDYKNQNQ